MNGEMAAVYAPHVEDRQGRLAGLDLDVERACPCGEKPRCGRGRSGYFFTDQRGVDACLGPGRDAGRSRWKGDEGALSFRKIDDSCDDRTRGLAGQEWKRAQVRP